MVIRMRSVGLWVASGGILVYGCAFNPFSPPDFDERPGAGGTDASSASLGAGQGGGGGDAGAGGTGGAACTCVDDENECTIDLVVGESCPDGDESKCHSIAVDQTCTIGWCSNEGECRDCKTCVAAGICAERCNGTECAATNDCKSGQCQQGYCCNEACVGPCRACNRSGVEGTCTRMPLGFQCGEGEACNAYGDCVTSPFAALGKACNTDNQCMSGACHASYCRSRHGEPCIQDIECMGNYCDPTTKTCQSCGAQGAMCPGNGKCLPNLPNDSKDDICQVLPGQPAPVDAECIPPATRNAHMCKLPEGEPCMRHGECQSHHCKAGKCEPNCAIDAHCPNDTTCHANKVCTMLAGEYCVEAEYCASGICYGFPPKCLP